MATDIQIYQTTFGFNNSGSWDPVTISLAPKNSLEYNILINGEVADDVGIPTANGQSYSEPVQWRSGGTSLEGTFVLSQDNGRFWLVLNQPNIVAAPWAGLTDGTSAVGGQFVIATWTGAYQAS